MGTYPIQTAQSVLVLTRKDVSELLTIGECIPPVEDVFRRLGEGGLQAPGILGTHVQNGGFHIKAGVLPWGNRVFYAAKANANFPGNRTLHDLPTIQGVVLLFDAECGIPLAVMDSIEITILRTGAATAVAAKYLARRDSRKLTIIGCGLQGLIQAKALKEVLPIENIYTYDLDSSRSASLATQLARELQLEARSVPAYPEGTRQSDVIVTCTTSTAPFLREEHIRPGSFIAAVGADNEEKQELDPMLLVRHGVVPDVRDQAAKIGELHHALKARLLNADSVKADLGEIVAGKRTGRTSDDEITIFDSTGMALQDVAAACAVYAKADRGALLAVALNH
jgi:alanine dehydrogenase